MKNLLTFLVITLFTVTLTSQAQIVVKSFRKLDNDMTARIKAPKIDADGNICAIIKVGTTQNGFSWDIGTLDIISAEYHPGECWLYVPQGVKRLTITHKNLGVLRDYFFQIPIEKATVYEMVLTTGKVITTVEETIVSQYLVITPEPADALVFIDDKYVGKGAYQAKVITGNHTYRVEAPLYHNSAGVFEITDSKKELNIKLKPAFGYINVSSTPESEATVTIDGKPVFQTTPFKSEAIASGEHKVQVEKEMYEPGIKNVTVIDGQTTTVDFVLKPTFADVTINVPEGTAIYLNNEKKSTGTWKGKLTAQIYSIEARLDHHRPAKKDIQVVANENQIVNLQPVPIYGSLDVETNPPGATLTLNGEEKGKTPEALNNLLIGDYQVLLEKQGYQPVNKSITIEEGKNTLVKENLEKFAPVKIAPVELPPVLTGGKSKNIWLVSALVTGAAGTFTYLQAGSTYEKYKTTAGNEATDLIKKVDLYNLVSPIAFGIAGFSALEFILKSGKQKKAKSKSNEQTLNLFPVPIKNGAGVGLAYQF